MKTCDKISRRSFLNESLRLGAAGLAAGAAHPAFAAAATEASSGSSWQIGCYTRPWDQFELNVALDAIAEAGFQYAGVMTAKGKSWVVITPSTPIEEARRIGEEVKRRGLKALSVFGDFTVAESLGKGIEGLRRLIDNCAACGAPNLLLGGTGEKKLYEAYYKAIAECCDYAAAKRVGLSIKPHGGLNATGPQCRQAIERVKHQSFGLWYDPGNIYYYSDGQLNPVDDAAAVDGLVVGMSVKDFKPPKEVMVTPGTGLVNFVAVFARLKQGGFTRGPLIVECLEKGDLPKITAEAKKALRFLEKLTGLQA